MTASTTPPTTPASPKPIATLARGHHEEDESERPLDFRLIARLMHFTRPYAWQRNWLVVLVLMRSLQLPGLTWLLAAVINGPIARGDSAGVTVGAFAFLLLAISTQIVMHFRQRMAAELGEVVVFDLRNALFAHLQEMPMSYFHRTKVGRIISRMVSDLEDIRVGIQEVMFVSLVQVGQMGFAAVAMAWYDPWLFLLVLGMAPGLWFINRYFHRVLSVALRRMRESFSRVTATLAESVLGIRVTQAFVRQDENARMFGALVEDHSQYNTAVMRAHGLFIPLLELNSQIFMALLLVVGGYRVLEPGSGTTLGELVAFFFMANLFFAPIGVLGNQYNQALTAMAGAERFFQFLDTTPEWTDPAEAISPAECRGLVEFERVTFGYDRARPVLNEISFTAKPGQMIALVGHTGSGKSSIINLLAKFYLPQAGRVLIDGNDLREIAGPAWHRHLGLVLQQNYLFTGTIGDNIRFARPEASDADVREICARLDCLDLFEALPRQFDTLVGERGGMLSAGQRQLACFARALMADPQVLILDEATSSIDVQTEQRLQRALAVLLQGRTSFVVAHRLSTIVKADLVLVLDHGRLVEQGTHAELLARNGGYARLYRRFTAAG